MSFIESMKNRYTTKNYDGSQKLDERKKQDLMEILRLCPSSINSQPWKFTFVSDELTKAKLSKISWLNTERVLYCDTVVVFSSVADSASFEKRIEKELPEGAVNYYKEFIKPLTETEKKDWFARQVYLALGVFLSACAQMGIDSTPMEGIEPEKYDIVLNQSEYHTVVAVAIGVRDNEDFNQPSKKTKLRRALESVIEVV